MCTCSAELLHEGLPWQDRATAHDLRNLFGIVACAAHLLGETPDREGLARISLALKRTAQRGEAICDAMFGKPPDPHALLLGHDLDGGIAAAIPLVRPLVKEGVNLTVDLRAAHVALPLADEDIETILIELVGNAVRHGEGASRIIVRSRSAAGRAWLIVADNGRGRLDRPRALHHGHGLARIDDLVHRAGGNLQLRRAKGGGMVVGLSFPISARPRLALHDASQSQAKENNRDNRQPIAA